MSRSNWQKVKEVFHEALRREGDARELYLNKACAGSIDLRIEVESLLISLDEAKSFLEQPVVGERSRPKLWQLQNGQQVSHYEIVEPIASGGMGEVYLAQDRKLRRKVALKILPSEMIADKDRMRRFRREADIISALNHPNIITIFEFETADGYELLASEFIKGQTLREKLRNGPMEVDETIGIAVQIASALDAAHNAGVIHRDIKPENVMIRDDGYVKVLDFGLAKLAASASFNGAPDLATRDLSRPGMIMGTVNYMSPEQTRALSIDARSDIFSFGVLLYEMLTGRPPFTGDTTADVVAAIIQTDPALASSLNAKVPKGLERIIVKCLEKEPDRRHLSAAELHSELTDEKKEHEHRAARPRNDVVSDAVETEIISSERSKVSGRASFYKRSRGYLLIALLVVGVLLAAFVAWKYFFENTKIESIAVMPFVNESGNADVEYLTDGMTETLISSLSRIPKLNVKARSSVFRYKGRDTNAPAVGKELNVQAILTGRVVQRGQDLILYVELVEAATENSLWKQTYNKTMTNLVALQTEIARDVSDNLKSKLSDEDKQKLTKSYTENVQAYQLYLLGRFHWNKRTPNDFRKAIDYFQQAIALDPNYALAYAGLADAYSLLPSYGGAAAREVVPKAKEAALKALYLDDGLAEAHAAIGAVLGQYDYDHAAEEREYRRALELNSNYATAHQWYGELLSRLGRHEEAFVEYRRALEIDPLSLIVNRSYGEGLLYARRYDEAIAQLKKTVEMDASFAGAHASLAAFYQMRGDYAESAEEVAKFRELIGAKQNATLIRESYAKGGWQGFLREMTGKRRPADIPNYIAATFFVELGDKDKAFEELNKAYENREIFLIVGIDPRLDALRGDARFQDLVRRVGLPQ